MSKYKPKVAVLAGGIGTEREISIRSGRCVADALRQTGCETIISDISPDDLSILDDTTIDVFFICLHGEFGEDGRLQKILEQRNLCYTHSGPDASQKAMNKITAKKLFQKAGIKTPHALKFSDTLTAEQLRQNIPSQKYIVKPVSQGSSVGVDIADTPEDAINRCHINKSISNDYMIEQFIPGREITAGILNGETLPLIEIKPKVNFYDYKAKYLDDKTGYLFDTITDKSIVEKIRRDALSCFKCTGCRHVARVDFILTEKGQPCALEINTVPGMTTHSCVPKAAKKAGISMPRLCERIVEQALSDYHKTKGVRITEVIPHGEKKEEKEKIFTQDP